MNTAAAHRQIPFNRPFLTGREATYVAEALAARQLSGDGPFTRRCQDFLAARYGFGRCLLTSSGTHALEMAAMLTGVGPGDEVIVPSYTFVTTALAFARQGATIVFADSRAEHPNVDPASIEKLITPRTKVLVVMHYAGCACDMDAIGALAQRHGLLVVEDAAQAIDSFYNRRALGSLGHFACFSFHATKNITCGEGGLLVVNDARFFRRAEILREKGTDRAAFVRGDVDKYGWVDTGSSFLASELTAAVLWAQLEALDEIQSVRRRLWARYADGLSDSGATLPVVPEYARPNGHAFYLLLRDIDRRTAFIAAMRARDIACAFHYQPLHRSAYARAHYPTREPLMQAERFGDTLVRLPLYPDLGDDQERVIAAVRECLS